MTPILISRTLRDRIANQAKRRQMSMNTVIELAIAESEKREFWENVRDDNAKLSAVDRQWYLDNFGGNDNLEDPGDDSLSRNDEW